MPGVRLTELVAALSLATDLGLGLPQEHVLRQTLVADRLAAANGLDERERGSVRMISLLSWVGCIADSDELARWFGDDVAFRADSVDVDKAGVPMLRFLLSHLAADSAWGRVTLTRRFLAGGIRDAMLSLVTHCQSTGEIADRLGLDEEVRRGLLQSFERWDGKGVPNGLAGDDIALAARIVHVADDAEAHFHRGGAAAAVAMLRDRRGTEFDPALVDLVLADPGVLDVGDVDPWAEVVALAERGDPVIAEDALDEVLTVLADYADLKCAWWLGHSRAVADLAGRAAAEARLGDATLVRRAGLVHRLGAVGVPSSIWNKSGALSGAEAERVRQVPYLTMRVLSRQPALAAIGRIAGLVRERCDGSGYPTGLTRESIPVEARLLAAAQCYQALAEDRPHRPALGEAERTTVLQDQVTLGRLDGDAVRAVLAAAGHRVGRRTTEVGGLTARECEVLRLLARGRSNREIAEELVITPKTVGTHVEHIYAKIGVSTRGAAALYAMRTGVIDAAAIQLTP
ncbi:MAG TPA: HD domain-containing phosphohydrolase [Nocardioides sp.]|nr:HD domain-containing phosphohydrolase [Nocardioides sp.]